MRRKIALLSVTLVTLGLFAAPATALDRHGHMLILHPQIDFLTVAEDGVPYDGLYATGWRKCIDMPVTPLQAHHQQVHTGRAGAALEHAGHAFVPVAPFPEPFEEALPWESCADFQEMLDTVGWIPAGPPPE